MLSTRAIAEFSARLGGRTIGPDDDGYDAARRVWNGMVDRYPGLIVRCHGAADVIEAVNFSRERSLLLAVRGGGHNVAGSAVCDGGLVIDLSPMKEIVVDPIGARTVRAQGGVTWGELDRETQAFGLATPGGVVSTTGIGGLTLGGGLGWLRRKYGLSCDNLVSVDIVTADGSLLTASASENPELFWGVRGGGGNFGVVTSFEFQLHPVGPEVMFAGVLYPLERARKVVRFWREFIRSAPDEVSSQAVFWTVPAVAAFPQKAHGAPVVALVATHCGSVAEGQRLLQPLRELGEPLIDLSGPAPFVQVQQLYDPFFPAGVLNSYWKSLELNRFDDEVIEAVVAAAASRPSPHTMIPIWHHGGAMSRRAAHETAYGDRGAEFLLSIDSTWDDPLENTTNIRWTRELWKDMHRFSSGSLYLNFGGFGEEGDALVRAAYGHETYERLVALKNKFDPGNLFRVNHNIRPTVNTETAAAAAEE
jgi:FAD/FMN-containing dehydrogenase